MNTIRYAMVDDEPAARRKLKRMLSQYPYVEYVGEAGGIFDAIPLMESTKPDVLFLDIKLTDETGFDLLDQLPRPVHTVFVTAYDDYALTAFEANAIDYLVKPIHPTRLQRCIQKIELLVTGSQKQAVIFKDISGKIFKLDIEKINLIVADGDYCKIHSTMGEFMLRRTMKSWAAELAGGGFEKLSRSTIINLKSIQSVNPKDHDKVLVTHTGQAEASTLSSTEWVRLKHLL